MCSESCTRVLNLASDSHEYSDGGGGTRAAALGRRVRGPPRPGRPSPRGQLGQGCPLPLGFGGGANGALVAELGGVPGPG